MKKILKVTVFFAILGLLSFSFVTCKHSSGSSDDDPYWENEDLDGSNNTGSGNNSGTSGDGSGDGGETSDPNNPGGGSGTEGGDDQEGGGDGSSKVEERRALTKEEVEILLNEGKDESNSVRYRQLWNSNGSNWGEFKFYKDGSNYVYEYDNAEGNDDQEQGDVVINNDGSVTLTATKWHNTYAEWKEDKDEWVETPPTTSSETHQNHKYCGFALQFYDDNTAEAYEWQVKDGYDSYIPTKFPTTSFVEPSGSEDKNANVVCECITADGNYYKKQ